MFSKVKVYLLLTIISLFLFFNCGGSKLTKGDEAMAERKYELAIQYYQEMIKEYPDDPEVPKAKERISVCYYKIGMIYYNKGKTDEALKYFEKSDYRPAYEKIINIHFNKGRDFLDKKQYKEALDHFDIAMETAINNKISVSSKLKKTMAKTYFLWAEEELKNGKQDKALEHYELILTEYTKDQIEDYDKILYRLFSIYSIKKNYDKAIEYLKQLKNFDPDYKFSEDDNKTFKSILNSLLSQAETYFKQKNYDGAVSIVEKASVLPNFPEEKQKAFRARIIFYKGKDLIEDGKVEEGLKKFDEAKEIDINIATEIINLSKRLVKEALKLQKRRKYQEAVNKILMAKTIAPDNKEIDEKYLPDAYYKLANSQYFKKKYKECLQNIKAGLALNPKHRNLNRLYRNWDRRVNALKKKTARELKKIVEFVEEQYKNAVTQNLLLGRYKNKYVRWQAKVKGMEEVAGKAYGKFELEGYSFYGLPGPKLDAQRFADSCNEYAKTKGEAVISGKIKYVEEFLGAKYIVVEISSVKFQESIE